MVASTFSVITVNSNYPSLKVVAGSNLPVQTLLFNSDPANTIYLADNNAVEAGNTNLSTPLPPLSSVTFDGTEDVYAATLAGLTANIQIYPTGASYFQVQGVSPIVQMGVAGGPPAGNITGAVPYQPVILATVGQYLSYDLNVWVTSVSPGTAGAALTAQVQLQWFDDLVSGIPVFEEDWDIWVARAAPSMSGSNSLSGCGPMHGKYMSVTIFLPADATSGAVVQYFNLFGSNRTVPYSDWRQDANVTHPSNSGTASLQSLVQGSADCALGFDNSLASTWQLAIGLNQYFLALSLYSGPAYFAINQFAATVPGSVYIVSAQYLTSGQLETGPVPPPGALTTNLNTAGPNGAMTTGMVQLPRGPCALVIGNDVSNQTLTFNCIAQQAA